MRTLAIRGALATLGAALLLAGSSIGAAASTTIVYFAHANGTIDNNPPASPTPATFTMTLPSQSTTWTTVTPYPAAATPAGTYTFQYWTHGDGVISAKVGLGWSPTAAGSACNVYASFTGSMAAGAGSTISAGLGSYSVPAYSYQCTTLTVLSVQGAQLTLFYDSTATPTNLSVTS